MNQQRHIIAILLLVTITYGVKINFFDTHINESFGVISDGIFSDQLVFWAKITGCSKISCNCEVNSNATADGTSSPLIFISEYPNLATVVFEYLKFDTLYSFVLSCDGTNETVSRYVKTDYGNPSQPQEFRAVLNSGHIRLSWLPPAILAGPISNYILIIDSKTHIRNIPNNQLSFDIKEKYIYGTTHRYSLTACNKNRANFFLCSLPQEVSLDFFLPWSAKPINDTSIAPHQSSFRHTSKFALLLLYCFALLFYSIFYQNNI